MESTDNTAPECPHCGQKMLTWEVPPYSFSDGLGWGTTFLYVCFNDECPFLVDGWERMMTYYGQKASYRAMCNPDTMEMGAVPVFSREALKGGIYDEKEERAKEEAEKKSEEALEDYAKDRNVDAVLAMLIDERAVARLRIRAAELLAQIGDLKAVEPIRNHHFLTSKIEEKASAAVEQIHKANYTRECPFCAEIIKARAAVCKHCGKELNVSDSVRHNENAECAEKGH